MHQTWHDAEDGGYLKEECVYRLGKLNATYKAQKDGGHLCTESLYKNGTSDGSYKEWYDTKMENINVGQRWTII